MNVAVCASPVGTGEKIELLEHREGGLFRRATSTIIPVEDWIKSAPKSALSALAYARSHDDEDEIEEHHDHIVIPADIVARLDDADAQALGIPSATSLTLQLRTMGSLKDGNIDVETKWVQRGGIPVREKVEGARISAGGRTGRLPEPIYSVLLAARALQSASGPDERRARFALLKEALGDGAADGISSDGYIDKLRIAYAANFSLDVKTRGGQFDFDPVLFSRHVAERDDDQLVDQDEEALLTPHETDRFRRKFRQQEGDKRSYLLSDGTILYLDPKLGDALEVVREKQKAPSGERREFLRSPQRVLRERLSLDEQGDDEAADRLFVETQQFSERVSGIEIWQKPVLPWIKPKPNSWLPEAFGIRVGEAPNEQFIKVEPDEADDLHDKLETASKVGEEHVEWQGAEVPVTPKSLEATRALVNLVQELRSDGERKDDGSVRESLETFFLQVGQNFEQVDYAPLPRPSVDRTPFTPPSLPGALKSSPKPHQEIAFNWLAEAWARRMPGVLLADDMGLGKTFQSLSFLLWVRETQDKPGPVLIVAPTGLLKNWQAEIRQHLEPDALGRIVEAFGAGLRHFRRESGTDIRGGTSRLDVSDWEDAGVVLTTYETMRDYHMSFAQIPFSVIVYDEIQKLKNPASQMTRAAKALNGRLQIAMTGTPVENRLQDLWSIADTVYPGFLGASRDFEQHYGAQDMERLQELQQRITHSDGAFPAFMLRRMKDEILTGLPEKKAQKYEVEMPSEQSAAYDNVLARARAMRQRGDKGAMLKVLHLLRGTSLHPSPPRAVDDLDAYIAQSARLKKTFEILEDIERKGEKALLFCEDLEMQAFLAMAIQERFGLRKRPKCISGKIAGPKRQQIVEEFQSSPDPFAVLILSPKAGGVGLTITAANHVIHLSRWWNPAVEDQATDRAYRIGQEKPVTIHVPIAVHPDPDIRPSSFDRRLDDLMERKRALSRGLLVPPESDRDVEELLGDVLDGRAGKDAGTNSVDHGASPQRSDGQSTPEVAEAGEETSARRLEGTLVVKSPMAVAEQRATNVQRVEYEEGGPRDWAIFDQYLMDANIHRLEIQDPWCCTDHRAREQLVQFVHRFEQRAARIEKVVVTAWDAHSADSRSLESNEDQRTDLERKWRRLPSGRPLHFSQRSRHEPGDFHDRHVKALLDDGTRVTWDIGRGIFGVMSARKACTVVVSREKV